MVGDFGRQVARNDDDSEAVVEQPLVIMDAVLHLDAGAGDVCSGFFLHICIPSATEPNQTFALHILVTFINLL